MVLVIRQQCLRALCPQRLHGVLRLPVFVPLDETHEDLDSLPGLVAVGLLFLDDAHHVGNVTFPATLGQSEGFLLWLRAVGMTFPAALLRYSHSGRFNRFGGGSLLGTALLLRRWGLGWAANAVMVLLNLLRRSLTV